MSNEKHWLLPDNDPFSPGWRLHLRRAEDELAHLVDEQVLPEKVLDPDANWHGDDYSIIWLKRTEAEWLHKSLGEMLADWPED